MKLVKTASGQTIKMSKSEWKSIGKTAGWIKESDEEATEGAGEAKSECRECGKECSTSACESEAGVFTGCPSCGSKFMNKK
jgi:hypothetical protein